MFFPTYLYKIYCPSTLCFLNRLNITSWNERQSHELSWHLHVCMWVVCIRSFEQHVKVCISTRQCAAMKADFLLSAASILCSQKNKHLEAKFDPLLYSITLLLPRLYYSYIRILLFGANSAKAIIGFLYNHPTVQIQFTLIVHFRCTMSTAVQLTTSLWKLKQDNTEAFLLFIVFFFTCFLTKKRQSKSEGLLSSDSPSNHCLSAACTEHVVVVMTQCLPELD